jgi:hypothetical protein
MTATPSPASRAAEQVSPDDLLGGFSQGTLLRWLLAALVIHAVVIGGLSIGTIRDWVDPEGAKARREALAATAKPAAPPEAPVPQGEASPAPPATATSAPAEPAAAGKPAAPLTPIEKATTEAARPEEIPAAPDDLGLSIEDTNPQ